MQNTHVPISPYLQTDSRKMHRKYGYPYTGILPTDKKPPPALQRSSLLPRYMIYPSRPVSRSVIYIHALPWYCDEWGGGAGMEWVSDVYLRPSVGTGDARVHKKKKKKKGRGE